MWEVRALRLMFGRGHRRAGTFHFLPIYLLGSIIYFSLSFYYIITLFILRRPKTSQKSSLPIYTCKK